MKEREIENQDNLIYLYEYLKEAAGWHPDTDKSKDVLRRLNLIVLYVVELERINMELQISSHVNNEKGMTRLIKELNKKK